MHARLAVALGVLSTVGLLAVGCSDDDSSAGGGTPVEITAANISFSTTDIKVPAGEVTFTLKNQDKIEHNLTIRDLDVDKDVDGGKTVKATATAKAGTTYQFFCEYHPDQMKGTITVS